MTPPALIEIAIAAFWANRLTWRPGFPPAGREGYVNTLGAPVGRVR